MEGASKRTKAYKTASALIEKHLELSDPNIRHPDAGFNSKDFQGVGCFSVMFFFVAFSDSFGIYFCGISEACMGYYSMLFITFYE